MTGSAVIALEPRHAEGGLTVATHQGVRPSDSTSVSGVTRWAPWVARYGLVIVFVWFAGLKLTTYEANGIAPLGQNSPFLSWIYHLVSVTTFSELVGCVELVTAALLAVGPWVPRAGILGGALATLFFVGTLSFMVSTPGIGESSAGGFPVLSATGEFLLKDFGLVGLSLWLLADSYDVLHRGGRQGPVLS
jgi:reactive chlorine resistance protein C